MEDFSLNLLCRGKSHLLPLTLDSLKAQNGSFEVILWDGEGAAKLQDIACRYEGIHIRVENGKGKNLAQMMNLGLSHSQGKYIQFLEPGERYISQYGFSYLGELLVAAPLLISARGVEQGTQSHWFLRSKLIEMGGFNEKIHFRPLFDLLCRLKKQGVEPLICSRVLIDGPQEPMGPILETCKILYRHFGFAYVLKWLFLGHSQNLHKAAAFFKNAFWRE